MHKTTLPTPELPARPTPGPSPPGARIKELRQRLSLSQKGFAQRLGLSQSTLSQIENDHYNPSYATIAFLAGEFAVDCNWLLKGTGEPFALGADPASSGVGYPTVHEKARAGYSGSDRDEHWLAQLDRYLVPGFRPEADIVVFQALGDSMDPTIVDQDFVLAERVGGTPENLTGHCVVCVVRDEIYVKRLANFDLATERLTLASDNPKYRTVDTDWCDILELWHVVGRVTRSLAPSILNVEQRVNQLEGTYQRLREEHDELKSLVLERLRG